MRTKIITVGGPVARFMRWRGWAGVTLPLPFVILVLMWGTPGERELLHELAHVGQVERMGKIKWWATYLWDFVTVGYYNSTLEQDARRVAGQE